MRANNTGKWVKMDRRKLKPLKKKESMEKIRKKSLSNSTHNAYMLNFKMEKSSGKKIKLNNKVNKLCNKRNSKLQLK